MFDCTHISSLQLYINLKGKSCKELICHVNCDIDTCGYLFHGVSQKGAWILNYDMLVPWFKWHFPTQTCSLFSWSCRACSWENRFLANLNFTTHPLQGLCYVIHGRC